MALFTDPTVPLVLDGIAMAATEAFSTSKVSFEYLLLSPRAHALGSRARRLGTHQLNSTSAAGLPVLARDRSACVAAAWVAVPT